VTEVLVYLNLGWLAFVALGAITQVFLMSEVVEGDGAFLVVVGVAVGSDSNVDTNESQKHHDDYQFFHFYSPLLHGFVWAKLPQNICCVYILASFINHQTSSGMTLDVLFHSNDYRYLWREKSGLSTWLIFMFTR